MPYINLPWVGTVWIDQGDGPEPGAAAADTTLSAPAGTITAGPIAAAAEEPPPAPTPAPDTAPAGTITAGPIAAAADTPAPAPSVPRVPTPADFANAGNPTYAPPPTLKDYYAGQVTLPAQPQQPKNDLLAELLAQHKAQFDTNTSKADPVAALRSSGQTAMDEARQRLEALRASQGF